MSLDELELQILDEHHQICIYCDFNFQFLILEAPLNEVNKSPIIHYTLQTQFNNNCFYEVILEYNPNEQQIHCYMIKLIIFFVYYPYEDDSQ
jgi:hypothetical protein